jgi:cysteine sulfinate desulfinase/cysteine desulfurase-like protein
MKKVLKKATKKDSKKMKPVQTSKIENDSVLKELEYLLQCASAECGW